MRMLIFALSVALVAANPAVGQGAKPKLSLDTPIHEMMEDPRGLAWLDRHFPGLSERMRDPEVGTVFAGVSIRGLSIDPDHGRALTPEVMAKLEVSLEKAQAETPQPPPKP